MRVSIKCIAIGVAVCAFPAGFAVAQACKADDDAYAEMVERCASEIRKHADGMIVRNQQEAASDHAAIDSVNPLLVPIDPILLQYNFMPPSPESWEGTRYCIRIYSYGLNGPARGSMIDGVTSFSVIPIRGEGTFAAEQAKKPGDPEPPPTTTPPATAPTAPVPPSADKPKPAAPPSLDELLGLTPAATDAKPGDASKPSDARPTDDASNVDLDRLLSAAEMGDVFKQAVTLMNDAAKRLNDKQDSSVQTQRIQEDVVRKLDQLLASLDQQQQQQQQPQQQQQSQDQKPGQQQKKQQQESAQQEQQASDPQEGDRPSLKQGTLKPQIDSARAAWGALPARVREMLMQGSGDRFSSRYKQMTEEYYKRLAEEAGR